jgi:quinol monooxygenase YgiN
VTILVTLELQMQSGKLESFCTDVLAAALPVTRAFDGCLSIEMFAEQGDDRLFLVQKWASRAQNEAYLAWRRATGLADMLAPYTIGPPVFRYFDLRPE